MARTTKSLQTVKLQTEIKKANQRIVEIGKKYGTSSKAYQEATKSFMNSAWKPYIKTTKRGVISISQRVATDIAKGTAKGIPKLYTTKAQVMSVPTLTKIKERTTRAIGVSSEEWNQASVQKQEDWIEDYYSIREDFESKRNLLYDIYTDEELMDKIPGLYNKYDRRGNIIEHRGTLSPTQLDSIIRKMADLASNSTKEIMGEEVDINPIKKVKRKK